MKSGQNFLLSFCTRGSICLREDLSAPNVLMVIHKVVRDMLVPAILFLDILKAELLCSK